MRAAGTDTFIVAAGFIIIIIIRMVHYSRVYKRAERKSFTSLLK